MKKLELLLLLLLSTLVVNAQEKAWNMLKNDINQNYIWGEGIAHTKEEADKDALNNLIQQISVYVTSTSDINISSKNTNGELDEKSQFEQSIHTYSAQTLTNAIRYVMGKAPNIKVGRAIKKADIEKMFADRANRAKDLVASAIKAEKKGRLDDALRDYYWALCLLKSLQFPNDVKYKETDGTEHIMTNWIKKKMENIFDDLKFACITREGDDIDLNITYQGKPVNSAAFTYYDGRQWSHIVTATDGFAKLEMVPGFNKSSYQLKIEYLFKNEAKTDKEIESVLLAVNNSEFRRSTLEIKGIKSSKNNETISGDAKPITEGTFTSTNTKIIKRPTEIEDKTEYLNIIKAIEQSICNNDSNNLRHYFTEEGWDIYQRLILYGSAKIVGVPSYAFYLNNNEVTARGMELSFSFKNNVKKSFVEEIIFTFNANQKIDNIAFGLGKTAEDDILNKGVWDQNTRLTIMNFLENYKTAYALKRYDYIKSIFDDNAIIITGRVLKVKAMPKDLTKNMIGKANEIIKYNRQTKDEYLKNLKRCFNSQEFINIKFSENKVTKASKERGEIYGIQLEQDYFSSSYGDHGYLFLYVDFNDPQTPLIKIRTWQPNKDLTLGPDGIYGLADFK